MEWGVNVLTNLVTLGLTARRLSFTIQAAVFLSVISSIRIRFSFGVIWLLLLLLLLSYLTRRKEKR
jgi:hypothetical protein